jgi:hypothetical protein
MVFHEDGEVIASFETRSAQKMGETVRLRAQTSKGQRLARASHDHGWLIGVEFGALDQLHHAPPNNTFASEQLLHVTKA